MVMMLAAGKSVEIVKVTVTTAVFNESGTWSASAANVIEGVVGPDVGVITPPVAGMLSVTGVACGLSDEVAMLNFPAF